MVHSSKYYSNITVEKTLIKELTIIDFTCTVINLTSQVKFVELYICIPVLTYFRSETTKDEPWAWEAREFLRKKLIGEEVFFTSEKPPNAVREYGTIYFGKGNVYM